MAWEGFEAFYGEDRHCYLRHVGTDTVTILQANPHRPLSAVEVQRRASLAGYLDVCSEDELIEVILLPLFRQLGFHRITAAGHKDKALEYGKDIWMRYTLPTQRVLYFGIQAKKGKLDASGVTKAGNANMAEIHNQALMMLAHEIFDPEINRRVLVDHAFIVAGGGITKQHATWERPRCLEAQPDHVPRPGRHPEPICRDQPATPYGCQASPHCRPVAHLQGRAPVLVHGFDRLECWPTSWGTSRSSAYPK